MLPILLFALLEPTLAGCSLSAGDCSYDTTDIIIIVVVVVLVSLLFGGCFYYRYYFWRRFHGDEQPGGASAAVFGPSGAQLGGQGMASGQGTYQASGNQQEFQKAANP